MLQDLIRREFNRWADLGRGRGMEKSHWDITRQMLDLMNVSEHDNIIDLGCGVAYSHSWSKYIDIPVQLLGAADYVDLLSKAGFRTVCQRRIIDSTPIPEDWKPSNWFPTRQEQAKFQAEGALLLVAEK